MPRSGGPNFIQPGEGSQTLFTMKSLKYLPIVLALEFIVVGLGMVGFGSAYGWLFILAALLIAFFPRVTRGSA
jgi:hypothetical protein